LSVYFFSLLMRMDAIQMADESISNGGQ